MGHKIVVCFRWGSLERPVADHLGDAALLSARVASLGGTLCSFGAVEIAFAFEESEHDEAVELTARTIRGADPAGLSRAGIAYGELAAYGEGTAFLELSWGAPVVLAAALARASETGQVLVDASLPTVADGYVQVHDPSPEVRVGRDAFRAVTLDVIRPLRTSVPASLEDPATPPDDSSPLGPALDGASEPPRGSRDELASTGGWDVVELARAAMQQGDPDSLSGAIQALQSAGVHGVLAERLVGVLALTRGAKEEGLRILRREAQSNRGGGRHARSILAYAIAVAAAGRPEDALLEALAALAVTRTQGDLRGEVACSRFLSQLAHGVGEPEAASAWEHVARRCEAALEA